MNALEQAIAARLRHMLKTARMWGSPEELETAAQHFAHVWLAGRTPGWTFEQTHAWWQQLGGPFAGDPDEHAAMRTALWGEQLEQARFQVVQGFVTVWAALERDPAREALVGPWLETLMDAPTRAGTPDRLNMVLFSLMGFVAQHPERYVEAVMAVREYLGGHGLRPLHVVAPPGPSEASMAWAKKFSTWPQVVTGITAALERLEAESQAGKPQPSPL